MGNNRFVILVLVVVLLVGVAWLNNTENPIKNNSAAQDASPVASAWQTAPGAPLDPLQGLPSEGVIGNPATAKIKVTIGYSVDSDMQQNPGNAAAVVSAASAWAKHHANASLSVVCIDIPPDQLTNPADAVVPLGLAIDGRSVPMMGGNPGTLTFNTLTLKAALASAKP